MIYLSVRYIYPSIRHIVFPSAISMYIAIYLSAFSISFYLPYCFSIHSICVCRYLSIYVCPLYLYLSICHIVFPSAVSMYVGIYLYMFVRYIYIFLFAMLPIHLQYLCIYPAIYLFVRYIYLSIRYIAFPSSISICCLYLSICLSAIYASFCSLCCLSIRSSL